MLEAGYSVAWDIAFSDGGAGKALDGLAKKAAKLTEFIDKLTEATKSSSVGFDDMAGSATRAATSVGGLNERLRAQTAAADASASASRSAASGFNATASAADRAAAAVARYAGALSAARSFTALPGGSVAAQAALAGSAAAAAIVPSPLSLYAARQFALPGAAAAAAFGPIPQPASRVVSRAAIESDPLLALPGGTDPAFNARAWWARQRARGTYAGSGASIPVPPGGFGPPGPPSPPPGLGWLGMGPVPGPWAWAAHKAVGAAKWGALGAAAYGIDGVHEAAELQTILQSIQNIAGLSDKDKARAYDASFAVGHTNAMTPVHAAEMLREIVRQSAGSMSYNDMLSMFPYAGKLQTVLGWTRGFSPTQTIDATMALTHLFRQYDAKGQSKMFDTVLRMGELMPDNLQRAVTQMTYFVPTLKNLHVADDEAAALMVAISRFGMGRNKGGTSIQNLFAASLGPLQLTSHAQAGKMKLLRDIGVVDAHGNSRFFTDKGGDPMGFLMQLYDFSQRVGSVRAQREFEGAFGKQGSRVAELMGDKVIIDQLIKIHDAITKQKSLGLDAQAHSLMGTAGFAVKGAWADAQALATELGWQALPAVTKGFKSVGNAAHDAQVWLHKHPDVEKRFEQDLNKVTDDIIWMGRHVAPVAIELGRDFANLFEGMETAARGVGDLATAAWNLPGKLDAAINALEKPMMDRLHGVEGWLDQHHVPGFHVPTKAEQNQNRNAGHYEIMADGTSVWVDAVAPKSAPSNHHAGGRRQHARDIHISQTFNIHGADHREVHRVVKKAVREALTERDPRGRLGTGGTNMTHPRMAAVQTGRR